MLVSWDWLKEYVSLDLPLAEVERRLMMSGLNHESTEKVGDDIAVDLEVTSNRPDCLGHVGIAREIAVLFETSLKLPAAAPVQSQTPVGSLTKVRIDCPELCSNYTARVIRGAKIGPSPTWMVRRLQTLGIAAINNIVDITNYVLMECGQPLHAFDLAKLRGAEIIVREARPGEQFLAINHKTYELEAGMCVIADAERPVALAGVMGGADTEVTDATADLLIESALFDPISIRTTARKLNLHSDSSYRFERGPDPEGVDWASRRCCELILELAGGELAAGVIDVGTPREPRQPIILRLAQIERVLGIKVDRDEVRRILAELGHQELRADEASVEVTPPSWRRDLQREIDLIEEVARIHGYDEIPEDAQVPMSVSSRTDEDRVLEKVRHALTAAGFDEALTPSVVDEATSSAFSPWTDAAPLVTQTPLLRGAKELRRSIVPSLLAARRTNEKLSNAVVELFEIANVYLPRQGGLPDEQKMLALTSGGDYFQVKGAVESLIDALKVSAAVTIADVNVNLFEPGHGGQLRLGNELLGYFGEVSASGQAQFELRGLTTVAEIRIAPLVQHANLIPKYTETSPFPTVERDLNFEVDESVRWSDLAATVRSSAGEHCEEVQYLETYRDEKRLGVGKKSLVLKIIFRKMDGTLTGEEADAAREQVVAACQKTHHAALRL
jgi:phenylalanyl-tRNA synthetase beta chain